MGSSHFLRSNKFTRIFVIHAGMKPINEENFHQTLLLSVPAVWALHYIFITDDQTSPYFWLPPLLKGEHYFKLHIYIVCRTLVRPAGAAGRRRSWTSGSLATPQINKTITKAFRNAVENQCWSLLAARAFHLPMYLLYICTRRILSMLPSPLWPSHSNFPLPPTILLLDPQVSKRFSLAVGSAFQSTKACILWILLANVWKFVDKWSESHMGTWWLGRTGS